MKSSILLTESLTQPDSGGVGIYIYVRQNAGGKQIINIFPTVAGAEVTYVKKPEKVEWSYVVINEKALYNSGPSIDFQLHESEESELVHKILTLSGITIKQPVISQSAMALDNLKIQQEKQ